MATTAKRAGRSFDSAYGVSFGIALGLILFIAGLVVSLTLGDGNTFGLIFGIPLLLAGLVVPLFMMRDVFERHDVHGQCPACSSDIHTTDAMSRVECPTCHQLMMVRDTKIQKAE